MNLLATNQQKILIIEHTKPTTDPHGLFSQVILVISNIIWCEKRNIKPVVAWGKKSLYYQAEGYNGSTEPWEYYFDPISDISVDYAQKQQDVLRGNTFPWRDRDAIPTIRRGGYNFHIDPVYRRKINALIQKYIKVKPPIKEKAEAFYKNTIEGKNTIGIHLRGTDKKTEVVQVSAEEICSTANELAKDLPNCQFFIATDEEALLQKAKVLLNGPVVYCNSFRSSSNYPIHKMNPRAYSKAKLGEEVIIEALIFSRCTKFVHTDSNISSIVLFMNPELDNRILIKQP